MNLEQLREAINRDIDDDLSSDELNGWINRALDDLSLVAEYTKKVTLNVIEGVTDYELPSDILKILVVGKNIRKLPINDFHSLGYKIIQDTLTLQPEPTEAQTIDVVYTAPLPHLENNEDVPKIPSNFHNLIVLYVVGRHEFQDEEYEPKTLADSEYDTKKSEFARYVQEQKAATNKVVDVYGIWW